MVDAKALSDAARRIGPALMPQLLDLVQGINALAIERDEALEGAENLDAMLDALYQYAIAEAWFASPPDSNVWAVPGRICRICSAGVPSLTDDIPHRETCLLYTPE